MCQSAHVLFWLTGWVKSKDLAKKSVKLQQPGSKGSDLAMPQYSNSHQKRLEAAREMSKIFIQITQVLVARRTKKAINFVLNLSAHNGAVIADPSFTQARAPVQITSNNTFCTVLMRSNSPARHLGCSVLSLKYGERCNTRVAVSSPRNSWSGWR